MGFKYYWAATWLWVKGDIRFFNLVHVFKEKPEAVSGRDGSYGLTDFKMGD
jgi:hypothetical protein